MGRISTGIGLVSNINYKDIIDQLMALEEQPKNILTNRIQSANDRKLAYTDLQTRLQGLKLVGTTLKKPSSFAAASTTSGNEDVLTATATNGAAVGSYQFQVARLVTSQQSISTGFANSDSAKVGAGTITVEMGGGELTNDPPLSQLNGGAGVRRGIFRITDRSGATAVIDTTAAVSLDDVIKKINTSLDVSVRARVGSNGIVLTDLTGKTTAALGVQDLADGHAAEDLGLTTDLDGNANTITGGNVNYVGLNTRLSQLNDGRGVRTASSGVDFRVTVGDGTNIDVTLSAKTTVGEVIDTINAISPTKLRAEIVPGGNGIRLVDLSGGGAGMTVTAQNGSKAATDLGIEQTVAGATLTGGPVFAGLNTVLLSSLKGGAGVTLGNISITDRGGATQTVDLSAAKTVQDVLDAISNKAGINVTATLNASKNGIQITDDTGATGNLVIADADVTNSATALGLVGTFDATKPAAHGANLQRQWVSENSLLADYAGGKGVSRGKFTITNSAGAKATVDLTQGNEIRLGDVIREINSKGIGVTASVNANGDGLLLTDSASGAGKLTVADLDSTTAADLNIVGEAAATTIDGSFEKTITVDAADTLSSLQTKINALTFGVTASIINDGSGIAPYRLSLNARRSGLDGRVVFDAGETTLNTRTLVSAQNAAVFVGGATSDQPLLITGSSNQMTGIVPGVNIELHGVSDKPVTLNVSNDIEGIVTQLGDFTQKFNDMVDKIADLTKYDTKTNKRGLLLGELAVQNVQTQIYSMLNSVVTTAGQYRVLSQVGLAVGDGAKLMFDEEKFRAAYATDPEAVKGLFTADKLGIGKVIEANIDRLTDPENGVITRENKTLDEKTQQFQDRITNLDKILESKRTRLETQFANLEGVLAGLQSQQQALGQITTIQMPSK